MDSGQRHAQDLALELWMARWLPSNSLLDGWYQKGWVNEFLDEQL